MRLISERKDVREIMAYGVTRAPALVIDEEIEASGKIPRSEEISVWLPEVSA